MSEDVSMQMSAQDVLTRAEALRPTLGDNFRDEIVKSLYREAEVIANRAVHAKDDRRYDLDQKIDRLVTSPILASPSCWCC
jgi:Fe2+ transport system protein B